MVHASFLSTSDGAERHLTLEDVTPLDATYGQRVPRQTAPKAATFNSTDNGC